jgi:dihydroflavonol-4-reductase
MILVTGATGLLGSRLLFDLALAGKKVRALKRESSRMNCVDFYFSSRPDLMTQIDWFDSDLNDIFSLEESLRGITHVYHCAGKVSFQPHDKSLVHQTNASGTANLINLCLEKKISKLCHVSSVAAIGRADSEKHNDENTPWKSAKHISSYAISKYGAEREVWRGVAEGLNVVIVNPGLIIGPGNWKTDSSMIFRQVWKGLSFYTDGVNGLVDVKDVSAAMISLMESEISSERFILVAENMPLREVMDRISDAFGKKRPSVHAGPFLTGLAWRIEYIKSLFTGAKPVITRETASSAQNKSYFSNEKIKRAIGYQFGDIRKSIDDTAVRFLEAKAAGRNN